MHLKIILLIALIGLSAFFSLAEAALLSLSRLRLGNILDKKPRGAIELKKLKDDPDRLLITLLVGNNIVNVSASAIATALSIEIFRDNALGIAIGIMTFLLLIFGEILPKSLGMQHNIAFSLIVAKPIWLLSVVFYPIIKVFDYMIDIFMSILGIKKSYRPIVTEEEIRSIVRLGQEQGAIKAIEKEMIEKIFKFDNISVREIMAPKANIVSINTESSIKEALDTVLEYRYSRYPVYEKSKDTLIGILVVKDILKHIKEGNFELKIKKIIHKPRFIFETKKIDSLLWQFQKLKEHMAIVINEKGKVVGLVTLEDVLEEIVGEIVDESEKVKQKIEK